jgi:heme/copper-type cytochrome/quinol oxidase subunit 1
MKPISHAYMCRRRKWAFVVMILVLQVLPLLAAAQNLGNAPVLNRAVQGQRASQPEGAILNMVNWIGNVIAPISAALCVVMAVVSYSQGRGVMRWLITAAGLLAISGLTRLIEFWINQGTGGVQ